MVLSVSYQASALLGALVAWDQASGPVAANFKSKAARPSRLPAPFSQERAWPDHGGRPPGPPVCRAPGPLPSPSWVLPAGAVPLDELEALGLVVGAGGS